MRARYGSVWRLLNDEGINLKKSVYAGEQVFAKLKTLLRKADERTAEDTWKRIGSLLKCFTQDECANDIRNSGYASNEMDHALVASPTFQN